MASHRISSFLAVLLVVLSCRGAAHAASLIGQRKEIGRIARQVRSIERLASKRDFGAAAAALTDARQRYAKLVAEGVDPRLDNAMAHLRKQLQAAHNALANAGVALPAPAKQNLQSNSGEISFVRQVAPLLLARCGTCHVDQERGGLSMKHFAALRRGSENGRVLTAGNAANSPIVELISAGEMPRGEGRVAPQELELLVRWINQGAKYDGRSPTTPLRELANAERSTAGTKRDQEVTQVPITPQVVPAGNDDSVRFALEIAPVLAANCSGCHGTRQSRARFSVATFGQLLKGGESGPVIRPGDAAASIIVQRLKGQAGNRMPLNRDPLPPETIAKIETWIREGAKFDGQSPGDSLQRLSALARADAADPDELSQMRASLAVKNWRLAIPDEDAGRFTTERFLVMGNLPESRLRELAHMAEAQADEVSRLFGHPDDQPLVKSRMTVFAVAKPFDYREFGTMIERRQLPAEWRGHWSYDGVDAYVVVHPAKDQEFSNAALLAQQIAGVYVSARARGRLPRWLIEGAARAAAGEIENRDPRVRSWQQAKPAAMHRLTAPDDFMNGKLPLEQEGVLSYDFVSALLRKPARFSRLLTDVGKGTNLDDAFQRAYRATPAQLAAAWAR